MSINPSERDRRLREIKKAAKDSLIEYYSRQFDRAMKDFEVAISRGDAMTAANSFMTATSTKNLLKDIESYEIRGE